MPTIKVLTWNTRGEDVAKANWLEGIILQYLPDVIALQETVIGGGDIFAMLNTLGVTNPLYYGTYPPIAVDTQGDGLTMMLSNQIGAVANPFGIVNLSADAGVQAFINSFTLAATRTQLRQELAGMRMPGTTRFTFGGQTVEAMTWHAPRPPSQVLQGNAAVNYDAYAFLQYSDYYTAQLAAPGIGGLGIIAGDLNVANISAATGIPILPRLLPGWYGIQDNLDYILGIRSDGIDVIITNNISLDDGLSDHPLLFTEMTWP